MDGKDYTIYRYPRMEDHFDMDLEVAGTKDGITALQMDIKISSNSWNLKEASAQAKRSLRNLKSYAWNYSEPRKEQVLRT